MTAQSCKRQTTLMQKGGGRGVWTQRLVAGDQGIDVALQSQQHIDAQLKQFQIIRLQRQGLIEHRQRIFVAPRPSQHHGAVFQQRGIGGPLRHEAVQQRQRFVDMALMRAQNTQRVQKLGIARLGGQKLPIQLLGLVQPAALVRVHRLIVKGLKVHGFS
jgi:hypothetical protein